MQERNLNPFTAEIIASISELQRRIAVAHNQLDQTIAEAREKIQQSRELLRQTEKP